MTLIDETRDASVNRNLTWVETQHFRGWGCSECRWVFNPIPLTGKSFEEVMRNFVLRRDAEFARHDCSNHGGAEAAAFRRRSQRSVRPPIRIARRW
jgi:hypothetical protein